jgi:hypothetical protein
MSYRRLAVLIAVWALVTWGGRIGLLQEGAGWLDWTRIAGSLAVAATAAALLWRGRRSPVLWVYSGFTALIWVTSLVSVWSGEHSVGFRLVHSALAGGSLLLAGLVAVIPRPGRGSAAGA